MSYPRVLGARVVIKPVAVEEKTASGIIIAPDKQDPKFEGEVVAVGTGARTEKGVQMPMEVAVGDYVIYSKMAGVPIEHNGEQLLIINERDVTCIIDKPNA